MKPTELQIDAISEAVRHITAGHHYAEAFINQWEAIRPPDPALILQAEEIDLLRKNCDSAWQAHTNLLREYHALHDAFTKFKSPDPKPTAEETAPLNIDLVRPFLERYAEFGAAERIAAAEKRESEARNQTPKP